MQSAILRISGFIIRILSIDTIWNFGLEFQKAPSLRYQANLLVRGGNNAI
jgi:hypothetical protein